MHTYIHTRTHANIRAITHAHAPTHERKQSRTLTHTCILLDECIHANAHVGTLQICTNTGTHGYIRMLSRNHVHARKDQERKDISLIMPSQGTSMSPPLISCALLPKAMTKTFKSPFYNAVLMQQSKKTLPNETFVTGWNIYAPN